MKLYILILLVVLLIAVAHADNPDHRDTVSFALVGDIMFGTDYPDSLRNLPMDNGRALLEYPKSVLSAADVAIGNLEGAICISDSSTKILEDSTAYVFRMPAFTAHRLVEAGFDVLNTANNHVNDFGRIGRNETESLLDSLGIDTTGRIGKTASLERNGISIGVIGFSTSPGNNSLLDVDRAVRLVKTADKEYDIVVITFHGGAEGDDALHLPDGPEMYYDEDRGDLRLFSRSVVDAGADIVFGHGPHLPRCLEVYKERIIAYSLGNFCTWFGISVKDMRAYAPILQVEAASDGTLLSFDIVSYKQLPLHYPVPDNKENAKNLIIRLSEEDLGSFPYEYLSKINDQ